MAEKKVEMITVYVENMGGGKVSVADSFLSVRDFPNKKEGHQAVGVYATKVKMPESHLKAFKGILKAHYPHQTNILSAEEYEGAKIEAMEKAKAASGKEPGNSDAGLNAEQEAEKKAYGDAMLGTEDGILTYLNDYPDGPHIDEVNEISDYQDAKETNDEKTYNIFLEKYPESKYAAEIKTILGIA